MVEVGGAAGLDAVYTLSSKEIANVRGYQRNKYYYIQEIQSSIMQQSTKVAKKS